MVSEDEDTPPAAPATWRPARAAAELFALCGLALAQPLFDVFGAAPDVVLAHGADRGDLVVFGLLVLLVPAAVLWVVELVVSRVHPTAARFLHGAFVVGLASAAVLQFLKLSAEITGRRLALAVALAAATFAVAYVRSATVRRWVVAMSPAPLVFLAVFLLASPAADAVSETSVDAVAGGADGNGRSVVMIVADELPMEALIDGSGQVDPVLYPNLARLAGEGTWFRNTGTAATVTAVAVPALLTGRQPQDGLAPTAADHPENLFTLLGEGYDLEAIETTTSLCPPTLCGGPLVDQTPTAAPATAEAGLRGLLDDAGRAVRDLLSFDPFPGPQPVPLETVPVPPADTGAAGAGGFEMPTFELPDVTDFVASIEEGEGPTVHFLHVQLPHSPYVFAPDGRVYQDRTSVESTLEIAGRRSAVPYETDLARQRLVLQTQYVDGIVGQVLDRLDETGQAEDTAVVFTSDHGVGLVPGEEKRPIAAEEPVAEAIYPDLLLVPLLLRAPGVEAGAVDDRNAMTVDVLPTLADLLDVEVPDGVEGVSLLASARDDDEKQFVQVLPRDATGAFGFEVTGTRGPAAIGPPVHYDGAPVLADALSRHLDRLFDGAGPDHRAYHVVPEGDLVGRRVVTIASAPSFAAEVELDALDQLEDYGVEVPFAPLRVRGRLVGNPVGPVTLAVAVDGVVAAVAPTFASGGDTHRIDLMLDHTLVGPGTHRTAVYAVVDDGRLAPIESAGG